MKPCDCKDQNDTHSMNEQGIAHNEWSLTVEPAVVRIKHQHYGELKMPMSIMKRFAEWYLEDQKD